VEGNNDEKSDNETTQIPLKNGELMTMNRIFRACNGSGRSVCGYNADSGLPRLSQYLTHRDIHSYQPS
jgi:hypothetical protein